MLKELVAQVGRFSICVCVCGGGGGQTLVLTDYWWGHWRHKPFSKLLGDCLAPAAPSPCSYAYVTYTYTL